MNSGICFRTDSKTAMAIGRWEVYCATNTINGKHYIGCTGSGSRNCWGQHVSQAKLNSSAMLHAAIRKYGEARFLVERITAFDDKGDAFDYEIELIKVLGTFGKGYNMTPGGETPGSGVSREAAIRIWARPEFRALRKERARQRRRARLRVAARAGKDQALNT
jgi:hypothetical protein